MTISRKTLRLLSLMLTAAGAILFAGSMTQVSAQRDPFEKPSYMRQRPTSTGTSSSKPVKPAEDFSAPSIEARIEYFKRLRAAAAESGEELPKVTSVLTLDEMDVTGIFKTPRGYAAMVEATPIKLSFTIYPGEKFFDGQLVAVEENRLVFRKVTKTGKNKFVSSVENKPLKQYTMKAQIEGTAPIQPTAEKPVQTASSSEPAPDKKAAPGPIISPLDEMNNAPEEPDTKKSTPKKPTKVARRGRN